MIPLMIDLSGKRVVIFGGGSVGVRKARYFIGESDVVVYSRSFHPDFEMIPCSKISVEIPHDEEKIKPLIRNSALVIAATSDTRLNEKIRSIALSEGILCNVAAGEPGDVTLPAKISGSRYTIAVTTHGSVPAVSRMIREHLEDAFPDLDDLIELGEWIRNEFRMEQDSGRSYVTVLNRALRDPKTRKALESGQKIAQEYILENYS
jgi:precorrin-2 dehydrogenase / sirohydrochlorin ferrochelatase